MNGWKTLFSLSLITLSGYAASAAVPFGPNCPLGPIAKTESPMENSVNPIATAGTEFFLELTDKKMIPAGSALLTSSGALEAQGITSIIHAATGAMRLVQSSTPERYEPTLDTVAQSLINSLQLARQGRHSRLAIPFVGGNIFLGRIGVTAEELLGAIVGAVVENRGELEIRFVAFGEQDTELFSKVLADHYPELDTDQVQVVSGSIVDSSVHGASAIVNAANMEVVFGSGVSGVIASASESAGIINQEAQDVMEAYYRTQSSSDEVKASNLTEPRIL